MKVYHGSYMEIRTINLSFGRPNRDFGRGFYVTKFRKPTHQICFCTTASLQALEYTDSRAEWNIEHIGNDVIKQIIADNNTDEIKATDVFYTSDTFVQLSDNATGLYLKPWQEIYEMLKKELGIRN